jgi:eukaryotic-like serine/threonine-protein kinase
LALKQFADTYDYEHWDRIKSLFAGALEHPRLERENWVRLNADDSVIADNVLKLIAHHQPTDGVEEDVPEIRPAPSFDNLAVLAGRFRITRLIGAGGMGEVYEATDDQTGDTVAIKALRSELAGDHAFVARLLMEVEVARRIAHRNICRVLEFYPPQNSSGRRKAFFTMELLNGETLGQRIARCRRLTPAEALPIVRQVGAGLAEVHGLGIIHGDLKPANIMLVPDEMCGERAVVMDFGLARTNVSNAVRGRAGVQLLGTLGYMAPEQFEQASLTVACDIYALGVTIYEMLTGRNHPLLPLSAAAPDVKSGWARVLQHCFAVAPENRPASVTEVTRGLESAESSTSTRRRVSRVSNGIA